MTIPDWRGRLLTDICMEETECPPHFDEHLTQIEDAYLTEAERFVIDSYYRDGQTLKDTADLMGIDPSNAGTYRNKALRKLREHKAALISGQLYTKLSMRLTHEYKSHSDALRWMASAIRYLESLDEDAYISEMDELTDEEKDYFTRHGFTRLSQVMEIAPRKIVPLIADQITHRIDEAEEDDIPRSTRLKDLGYSRESVQDFYNMGITTVGDILDLDEDDVMTLSDARKRDVIHLYRMERGL